MKKIITALGNYLLNDKLLEQKEFQVISRDIQYQEGIFEIIEKNNNIDYLILNEILPGENNILELVEKIKEQDKYIKIIIILENKNEELENKLYLKNINKIYYDNQIEIDEIINYLKNESKNENEKIKDEIEKLKKILIENNILIEENKLKNNELLKTNIKENNTKNKKVISIAGTGGVGKSVVTLNLSNYFKSQKEKVLIIDFDILNNSLHTLLGVSEYSKKIKNKIQKNDLIQNKINVKDLIIKINKKVDLISGINLLFDSKYKISNERINSIINELKIYYDIIIIDTSSECFLDYTKNILNKSDNIIFLLESNLIEVKKANNLLKIYTETWKIKKEKINIIINKYNENSIDDKIIKNIFSEYKILGKIKLNKKYNILINKNYKENIINNDIKKEYKKISEKIIKLKNRKLNTYIENIYNKFKYLLYQRN